MDKQSSDQSMPTETKDIDFTLVAINNLLYEVQYMARRAPSSKHLSHSVTLAWAILGAHRDRIETQETLKYFAKNLDFLDELGDEVNIDDLIEKVKQLDVSILVESVRKT